MRQKRKKKKGGEGHKDKMGGLGGDPGGLFIYPDGAGIADLGIARGIGARESVPFELLNMIASLTLRSWS